MNTEHLPVFFFTGKRLVLTELQRPFKNTMIIFKVKNPASHVPNQPNLTIPLHEKSDLVRRSLLRQARKVRTNGNTNEHAVDLL